jgi:hypothetical protein
VLQFFTLHGLLNVSFDSFLQRILCRFVVSVITALELFPKFSHYLVKAATSYHSVATSPHALCPLSEAILYYGINKTFTTAGGSIISTPEYYDPRQCIHLTYCNQIPTTCKGDK